MGRFEDIVRKSIRKDFAGAKFKKPKKPHAANTKRIVSVDDRSEYARWRKFLLGKIVHLEYAAMAGAGIWVSFVNDADRKALNRAAGWSDEKTMYLLNGVKFDD